VKKDRLWKHLTIAFVLALVLYAVGFSWIEHRRARLGPWQITFVHQPPARPFIEINQDRLGIRNVQVRFPAMANLPATNSTMAFLPGQPVPFDVPFGQCVFQDPTFLPGTVALQIGAHVIEILPRALSLDGKETAWKSGLQIEAQATRSLNQTHDLE
jgi:hypothetical protein